MSFKKKLLPCMVITFLCTMLFSCSKNVSAKKDDYYTITNPYTGSMSIFDKNGKVIVKTIKPGEEYLSIIKDELTDKPIYISKSIIGEKKLSDTYTYDNEEYSYDYPSNRVVLYDMEGNEVKLDKEISGGVEFAFNNYLIFTSNDVKYAYNPNTNDLREFTRKIVGHYKSYFIASDYLWDEKVSLDNVHTEVYDKDFNLHKVFDRYSYDFVTDIGNIEFLRLTTKKDLDSDKFLYNFASESFDLVFDDPIENSLYREEETKVLCKRNGKKFVFDFEKKEIVGSEEIDTEVPEVYDPDKYEKERQEMEFKFADIDSEATWNYMDRGGKRYYYNSMDKLYNPKTPFSIYDENKNVILSDLTDMDPYISDDFIVCCFTNGTKIYDNSFNVIKDFGDRKIDVWLWITHENNDVTKYYSFSDKEKDSMGILDEKFNVIIDKLKSVSMLEDDHFTYMDGFEYGFMDYKGKKLFTFSIFDDFQDENSIFDENNDYYENETEIIPDPKNYPRVDGSTANMPMMAEIRSEYLKEDKNESENNVSVTTTDYAWRNLLEGKNDLLLVYEPSSETKEIINNSSVKLKIVPIGVDALVFINNEQNPISNLSTDDLIKIYTGRATNWIAFDGLNKPIEAFQRPLNSGSQTLFLNLLMKDKQPVDAPKSYRPQGMDDLIEVLAAYNNSANAIGYSVYYYAKKMYSAPGLRLMSVDGIEPNDETISNGTYPFINEYYLVIREDTPEDSETMKLFNFIQSSKGKEAIKKAGYIPR